MHRRGGRMSDDMPAVMKGGRPPKPARERLSSRLWVQVTDAEADRVHVAALRAGQSVSEFLRLRLKALLQASA